MRVILDTSVLIGADAPDGVEAAISVVSLTELHFGVLLATDPDERARRTDRLAAVEATFDPLPVTPEVARAWGRLAAAVSQRGGKPRRRQLDLAIAATATVENVPLLTHNVGDFGIIEDLVDARKPDPGE
ncbi:PIN domain-containing protein [Ornithinimicrobium cryptoxanthini]|uniref:Ribonuclease VapC n=1 Tax=Ornithinimicrobium cryptoxanthini TaxID=2934161 RepID=A0ABY4YH94_9MICO|nr:PIN domain-containing protein [Ornithinimicrobium cryptoxanthini]USQ76134.1 PIN domain-containing protein [Ornithinimicrobium cryptoxanthini]